VGANGETKARRRPSPPGRTIPASRPTRSAGPGFTSSRSRRTGNAATIHPHNGALKYGRTYRGEDRRGGADHDGRQVRRAGGRKSWTFTTKAAPPKRGVERVVVSADGKGDFNTVQGAIDFAPDKPPSP
jgi:pectinesterase